MIHPINLRVDLTYDYINKDISLHEYDVNGTELVLSVYDSNSEFDLTGCTAEYDATIAGCLAEEAAAATITPDSNIIKVPVTANMTAMNGKLLIDVKIKKNNDILTVYTVSADVKRAVINGATIIDISGTTIMQRFNEIESMIAGLIDPSLSKSGKAADAAAVGEALSGKAEKAPYSRFVYAVPNYISTLPDNAVHVDDATDPNVIYKYMESGIVKGLIIAATDDSLNTQSQYYFAPDGKFRYRRRTSGEDWPSFGFSSLLDKIVFYKTAKNSNITNPDREVLLADATDPNTLYRYNGQGLILPAVSSTTQTQYYFAEDGILRYRTRKKINGSWDTWDSKFKLVINQGILGENLNPYLSPQNKLDKYFVRTCIDKSKVNLDECSCILGFGDSIMATSDGGSWLDILKTKVGYSTHYNYAIGNAHFSNNNYGGTRLITKLNAFFTDVDNHAIDVSAIDLIIVACGTNDAKNGTPINTFKTDVNKFFTSLKSGFTNRDIECPPVLVITPIRRGTEEDINAVSNNNLEIKVAKYGAILNNLALQAGFSVLNGFDIPVLVDDMDIDVGSNTATITSFMYDDGLHVHPDSTTGRTTYAQAVINAIGGGAATYTKTEIDAMIGDIGTALDILNANLSEV